MAIIQSAKKAIRGSARKRVFNTRRKEEMTKLVKDFRKLIVEKKKDEASALLQKVYQAIDKAAKTKYIKKNAASRKKSRLSIALNKI